MEAIRDRSAGSEPALDGADVANSYIATVYFKQAASLLRQGLFAESEPYWREVLRLWPDHAGALNNLGTAVWQQKRIEEAEVLYRRALDQDPHDFGILNNLGNALWEQGRHGEAIPYYRRALQLQPEAWETQMNLGVALSDHGEFDEAMAWLESSLRLRPDSPEVLDNIGMTLVRQGDWEGALRYYDRALDIRPDFAEAHRNRAYVWLARGDYERGWPEYEWRERCRNHRALRFDCPRWAGQNLGGRSILLHTEQGLGDTLQFVRFAATVKRRGGRVLVSCPPALTRLLYSCPFVDRVLDHQDSPPDWEYHAPLLSLPAILKLTLAVLPAESPYLFVDEGTLERWRPVVAQAFEVAQPVPASPAPDGARIFRIGIAWQGNPRNRVDRWRSFPLHLFAHLAELPGVRLISLQKGDGIEQLAGLAGRFPVAVLADPGGGPDRRDFLDTAAVMKQLDLVIAPESAVAHLAGGLGVRVWVPLSSVGDWRWLRDRSDSPWYPTLTLFRQAKPGDWDEVFHRMAESLGRELAA
jgi:Flp pilus assembly protein TadD